MQLVTDELKSAIEKLGLKEQNTQLLSDNEGQLVFSDLLNTFVEGAGKHLKRNISQLTSLMVWGLSVLLSLFK